MGMKPGTGSTVVQFDLYGGSQGVIDSPQELHRGIKRCIENTGLTIRNQLLDVWDSIIKGPCTSVTILEESHVRVESWTEHIHVNGEVQICNYSRTNFQTALNLALEIIALTGSTSGWVMVFTRGPRCPMEHLGTYSLSEYAAFVHKPALEPSQ